MAYKNTVLRTSLSVRSIISIHYFDYMSDFSFPGESHDFWELLCVDKGEIDAVAGDKRHTLKRGSIIFHQPNEFHNVITNGRIAPSLVVIAFECRSPCMDSFRGQILTVQETESALLAQIIIEARQAFLGRLDDIGQDGMVLIEDIVEIFDTHGIDTEIIAASIRHPVHVLEAAKAGAHIATIPYATIMQMIKHPLTTAGIERFLKDWETVPKK